MPRPARLIAHRWADITQVLMIPNGIYNLVDNHIFCTYCTVNIHHVTEANIRRHHYSQLHVRNTDLQAADSDPSDDAKAECISRTHAFYYDLAEAFMAADILFEKLNNSKFVEFLENNMKRKIPDPSTLRKTYTNLVYEKKLQQVRDEVADNPIYSSVDETNDSLGRLITHAIVAPLIADTPGIPRIIHCAEILQANAQTIAEFVESSLSKLWPGGIRREKVLLLVSDAAPYMMAAGRLLRANYHFEKLLHVSCLAHGLHRIAEEIRGTYGLANDVIAETKAVFSKSPRRKRLFCRIAPGIPLPPKPIVTRWGEWLKAASYYCNNFRHVQAVIEQLEQDAAVVDRTQELWATPNLQREFEFIHEQYCFITVAITRLEKRGMTLLDSAQIFTEVAASIQRNPTIPANVKEKMQNVFLNNTGFSTDLINICRTLQGVPNQDIPNGWDIADIERMRYAPTTSCEVERSFSSFKSILRSNRQTLTTETLEKFVVVFFNQLEFVDEPA